MLFLPPYYQYQNRAALDAVAASEELLVCDSADFDGTNDYMTRGADLTGNADSKLGIVSIWVRLDGGDDNQVQLISGVTTVGGGTMRFQLTRTGGNALAISIMTSAGATALSFSSSNTLLAGAAWRHILASWDMTDNTKRGVYVDDAVWTGWGTYNNTDLDYTLADWSVGARGSGAAKLNGCLAEVYFAPGQYIDVSVEANRRKFRSTTGKPISLGADGSTPTGVAPLVYFHLDDAEAVANFAANRGSGGNFSITGTLDTGSSSPSD